MQNRFVRLCVVAALVASAAGAAVIVRSELTVTDARRRPEDIARRVDRLHVLVIDAMRAEAAYVAPGQDATAALVRFPKTLNEISTLTGELSALRQSPAAVREVRTLVEATAILAEADAEAREHLLLGDVQSASHSIFGKAGAATQAMTTALGRLGDLERAEVPVAKSLISDRTRIIGATVAALWVIALMAFALVPVHARRASTTPTAEIRSDAASDPPGAPPPPIDLDAAADLCTAIARVESTGALSGLLSQAVTLLDVEGIVVWLESAGQLFAVAAAGYPPDTLARLTPIARDDINAVATAWREATVETVDVTPEADGAVAVPLFNAAVCVGVFAVALKSGRELDAGTCSVARLLAAQLAVVVGGSVPSSSPARATGT